MNNEQCAIDTLNQLLIVYCSLLIAHLHALAISSKSEVYPGRTSSIQPPATGASICFRPLNADGAGPAGRAPPNPNIRSKVFDLAASKKVINHP